MQAKKPERVSIIGRGFAGWHATGVDGNGNRFSSSGGDLLSREWRTERAPGYLASAQAGTPVYDAHNADSDAFARFVIAGPIPCPMVPAGCVQPLEWDRTTNIPLDACPEVTPLTKAAPDAYVRMLFHAVPGVRFGVVAGRGKTLRVEWDDGTTTPYT